MSGYGVGDVFPVVVLDRGEILDLDAACDDWRDAGLKAVPVDGLADDDLPEAFAGAFGEPVEAGPVEAFLLARLREGSAETLRLVSG